jgi:ankyrin repeat protein
VGIPRGGTIYVADHEADPRITRHILTLNAFTPEGKLKWTFETEQGPPSPPHTPVIGQHGTLYYVAQSLFAVTPEGKRKWRFASGFIDSSPSIGADGMIYVVTWDGKLFAVTPEGTHRWSFETGGRVTDFPVIGADQTIYLGTETNNFGVTNKENTVFAIHSSSKGHAAAPWPSSHTRWTKHGGAQAAIAQAPSPVPVLLPADADPQQVNAIDALQQLGIPFAPERFLECAAVGDGACVSLFLVAGLNPDVQDELGGTALMRALQEEHLDVAKTLLEMGANPDLQDKNGGTTLMDASLYGHLNAVEMLLDNNANPNVQNKQGSTALSRASYHGYVEVVRILLESGADPNLGEGALIGASEFGHTEVVKMLLASGADPNPQRKNTWWTATALMSASYNGHLEVVQLLLKQGADMNLRDRSGRTALMVAASEGHVGVVKSLLEKGADINARDDDGKTALAFAKAHTDRRNRAAVIAVLDAAAEKKE